MEAKRGYGIGAVVTEQDARELSEPLNLCISIFRRELVASENATLEVPPNSFCVIHNVLGCLLVKEVGSPKVNIVPKPSFVLLKSGSYCYRLPKGSSAWIAVSNYEPAIGSVLEAGLRAVDSILTCQVNPQTQKYADALPSWVTSPEPIRFFRVLELFGGVLTALTENSVPIRLTPLAADRPGPFRELCQRVQSEYHGEWTTQSGAATSGYSTHHFSRTFKQVIGVGFHDYVEAVRTERAIGILSTGDRNPDQIARDAGFGSLQALRDALRDHLGISLNDVRALRSQAWSAANSRRERGTLS